MSEPLSTFEIEDVLSSIRRLVSEDLRPTHKLVSAALQNGAAKLILTPALRVVSNEQPGFVHTADALDDPGDLQSVLDGIETTETAEAVEIMPMFGSVRLQEMADVRPYGSAADDAAATDANFLASAMSRINGLSALDPARNAPPETIVEVVAAVGAAVGPDEWEVDGGEPAPQAKAWEDTVWNSGEHRDAEPDQDNAAAILVLSDPVVAEQVSALNDSAKVVAEQDFSDLAIVVPADIAQGAPEPEISPATNTVQAADLMGRDSIIFHEEMLAEGLTAVGRNDADEAQDDADRAEPDPPQDADDATGYLNEDILREIVRDMIQAELQGTLGERITRNVRKLVRSEINRALAARDYE